MADVQDSIVALKKKNLKKRADRGHEIPKHTAIQTAMSS